MHRTGIADLPLHGGKVPPWLYQRMARLGALLFEAVVHLEGTGGAIRRLADPFWFQALGALLGMDWHSSGVTTTLLGSLKQGWQERAQAYGLFICGGKGKHGLATPQEICEVAQRTGVDGEHLIFLSRMTARVDSRLLQDGYTLYHHSIVFDLSGNWAVIEQGLQPEKGTARRYHWLGEKVSCFWESPHTGVSGFPQEWVLDLTAPASRANRSGILELFTLPLSTLLGELRRLPYLRLPSHHAIFVENLDQKRLHKVLLKTYENIPQDFRSLIMAQGVGPKTFRALSLVAELLYGHPPSFRDPARFAYAHGGKDGHPYPFDRRTYEDTILTLERAVEKARLGEKERLFALRRLHNLLES